MMATVPHVTSGLGLRKFQADGFLLTQVYINIESVAMEKQQRFLLLPLAYIPVNNGNALTSDFCTVAPDVAVNNRAYLGLHVKCPTFLSDSKQIYIF